MLCRADCYGARPVWDGSTLAVDSGPAAQALLWPTFRGDAARLGHADLALTPTGAIGAYWSAHPWLGAPTGPERAVPGGRAQSFAAGQVLWSTTTGAHSVVGGILADYLSGGGPAAYGLPLSDEADGPSGSRTSVFQRARIWWSPPTGAHAVLGAVLTDYLAVGGPAGPLGLPITDEADGGVPGARVSVFQHGRVYWSGGTGAQPVYGGILDHYLAAGGPARFGLPVAPEGDREGARAQDLQAGRLYWTAAGGTASVLGAIEKAYDAAGGAAAYGLPLGDERTHPVTGSAWSAFTLGEIHWSAATGAHGVRGAVLARWGRLGGPASPVGLPVTDEVPAAAGGRASRFQRGDVDWSAGTGAWEVMGAIRDRWYAAGGAGGPLGLPVSGEYDVPGGRRSDFTGGSVLWSATTGATAVVPR